MMIPTRGRVLSVIGSPEYVSTSCPDPFRRPGGLIIAGGLAEINLIAARPDESPVADPVKRDSPRQRNPEAPAGNETVSIMSGISFALRRGAGIPLLRKACGDDE